jgi:hypothetical protein
MGRGVAAKVAIPLAQGAPATATDAIFIPFIGGRTRFREATRVMRCAVEPRP